MPPVTIAEDKFDQICKSLDRVTDLETALDTLKKQYDDVMHRYGAGSSRGLAGTRVGGRWAGAESDRDSDDMKREFLHWIRTVTTKRTYSDTPQTVVDAYKRALNEASDSAGGHLVPEIFVPELIRVIEVSSVMRSLVRIITMTTDTSNLPSLVSNMTVYWPDELQEITQSDAVFGKVTLNLKMMAALTSASIQVSEDSALSLADLLVTLFGEAIGREEDKQLLAANAAPFSGLMFASNVNVVTMGTGKVDFSDADFNDILDLVDSISEAAQSGARFFLNKNILANIRKIRDLNHQYIWSPSTVAGDPPTIYGYPYTKSDTLPANSASSTSTAFLGFGNPNYMFLGDRQEYRVEVSDHVGFKKHERFWKVTNRIAVAMGVPTALARMRTAAS